GHKRTRSTWGWRSVHGRNDEKAARAALKLVQARRKLASLEVGGAPDRPIEVESNDRGCWGVPESRVPHRFPVLRVRTIGAVGVSPRGAQRSHGSRGKGDTSLSACRAPHLSTVWRSSGCLLPGRYGAPELTRHP